MKNTDVVILNWNGQDVLPRYLSSVVENTPDAIADVIVADNASTDGSVRYVRENYPSVRIISLDKNYGFAQGYNRVIDMLNKKYVVLLNSDVRVTAHWLEPLIECLENDNDIAAVQPKILSDRNKTKFEHAGAAGGLLDRDAYPYCYGRRLSVTANDIGQYEDVLPIFWASGACLCIRRCDYITAGGLDARFFAHMEEIDLCWRLKARAKQIYYIPKSVVYHYGGATLPYNNPRKTYLNFRNNLLMIYKNVANDKIKGLLLKRFILDIIAALTMLFTAQWNNFISVLRAIKDFYSMKADFTTDRQINLNKTVVNEPVGWTKRSIIMDHYIFRKQP